MSDNASAMEKAKLYDELVAAGKAPSLEEVEEKRAKAHEEQLKADAAAEARAANPQPEPERRSTERHR